jgi:hypothetical protein
MTPVVIRFISAAQSFFAKAGNTFSRLNQIHDKSKLIAGQQPQSNEGGAQVVVDQQDYNN